MNNLNFTENKQTFTFKIDLNLAFLSLQWVLTKQLSVKEEFIHCLFETDQAYRLSRACSTIIQEGMEMVTNSEKIVNSEKHKLSMIIS
ncbi:hydrogenase subunit [Anaeramoeba flamelloides]|uniref:Hydrogenase subunit n=1 Tax=Anaeramoeba flamelloides TaxID=1746091 RepID=A0ABQ8X417_9EUKA|nr:hydrogenase subunit [Anaeramoeba flamelloides]